jgi:hypothetical protein
VTDTGTDSGDRTTPGEDATASEIWQRLTTAARERVDAVLIDRGVFPAIVVLRRDCGLDPVPGLYDARDALLRRRRRLIDQGTLTDPQPKRPDIPDVIATATATTDPVVAIEAIWDGDTQGWMVDLVAIVDRPSSSHRRFDQARLASIRLGSDLRLFNGQVPPWPEAPEARRIGEATAAHLDVPFHFESPDTPDIDLPRWWDRRPVATRARRYRYVGPADVRPATLSRRGHRIASVDDLAAWLESPQPPAAPLEPYTFVIDIAGDLRVADRHSEHVACAGGGPVLSAGEMTFGRQGRHWAVAAVSNQSTGYCPEPSSWSAVAAACEQAGLTHPGRFTTEFEFRRCPDCDQINLVKDADFSCAACGGDLPPHWNLSPEDPGTDAAEPNPAG